MNYNKPLPKEQYERISAEMSQSKMAHGGDVKNMIDYEIQMRGICKNHNCTIDQYRASEKMYKEGGNIAEENREMVANNNKQIAHHTKELANTLKKADEVPAWVVAKVNRSASDLSDVTHYLDGEIEYAKGGRMPSVSEANIKDLEGEYVEFHAMGVEETKTYRIANARVSPNIYLKRDVTLIFEDGADAIMPLEKLDDYLKGKTISLTDYKGEKYAIKRVGKMAKGGGVKELTQVEGYFSNNDVNNPYTFSSNGKGLDRLTNHKNIEVLSVGYGKKDFFYGWDDSKNDGTLYFGKWNEGNFGYKFYGKINYAKGGVTELHISDQANLNDVLADARKLSITQKTPMYIFQRPSGEYVIADDEDSKMYELDKMNSRFVTFYANGKKYEDGGMVDSKDSFTLIFGGKQHVYDVYLVDGEFDDIDMNTKRGTPLDNWLSDQFDEWLENAPSDTKELYYGDEDGNTYKSKRGAVVEAIENIANYIQEIYPRKTTLNLDKYEIDFSESWEYEKGGMMAKGGQTQSEFYRIVWGLGYYEDYETLKSAEAKRNEFVKNPPAWARLPKDTPEILHFKNGVIVHTMGKGGQTQKEYIAKKVGKVMHEFKQGDLRSSSGQKVTNPKQAIAIGLSEGRVGWKHKRNK